MGTFQRENHCTKLGLARLENHIPTPGLAGGHMQAHGYAGVPVRIVIVDVVVLTALTMCQKLEEDISEYQGSRRSSPNHAA